ncbi:MAG: hypothetical protein ACPGVJ_06880, partial [Mangrovicoccus sp.]
MNIPFTPDLGINVFETGTQSGARMTVLADGRYVVTWHSQGQDGSDYGIFAQLYTNTGQRIGTSFQVNSYAAGSQDYPQIAALEDGGFVIVWQSYGQDGDRYGGYGQRFDAAGQAIGDEFQINTITYRDQTFISVVGTTDGGFAITFTDYGADTSSTSYADIRLRIYDDQGQPVAADQTVNTVTYRLQTDPKISRIEASGDANQLSAGGLVVVWTDLSGSSDHPDRSSYRVLMQRFAEDGTALGIETQVNTTAVYTQHIPVVAGLAGGRYVVSWMSTGNEDGGGYYYAIVAQVYNGDGTKVGG